jgi:hypothetical protein
MTSRPAHELQLSVAELHQLFGSLDPAPFRQLDIDPQAAEYIVASAHEPPTEAPPTLQVQRGREPITGSGAVGLAEWLGSLIVREGYSWLASASLVSGGSAALWRPLEIFLDEWWPPRADTRLCDRQVSMSVSLAVADVTAGSPP